MNDQTENSDEKSKKGTPSGFITWLKYRTKWTRIIVILPLAILHLLIIALSFYFFCYYLLTMLWNWGFVNGGFWSGFFAVYGALILITIPLSFLGYFIGWCNRILDLYAEDAQFELQKRIQEIESKKITYETKLEKADTELLIPLITYSKLELETYYKIGLNQTRKSYRFSILAMWIGFFIIVLGIIISVAPLNTLSNIFPLNENTVDDQLKLLIVSSGIVIEIVSGLFFWIYRNSMIQLTYFYNRQIYVHNALFAFRIAQTMKEPDEAKKIIVNKILDFQLTTPTIKFKIFRTEKQSD